MALTTTSIVAPPVPVSFINKLLSIPTPYMIHSTCAEAYTMPAQGGQIARFRRPSRLQPALVPLGNSGITPPSVTPQVTDLDAKINFYGSWMGINEQVVLTSQDPVLNWMTEQLGIQLRETEDLLMRNMLQSTATVINATGGTNGDNPTQITDVDVARVIALLFGANAMTLADKIEGQDRFGTSPVRNSFFAMGHTDLTTTLQNVNGFTHSSQYPSQMNILQSEWGSVQNIRFLLSSIGTKLPNASALGQNVYKAYVAGMESYAYIAQDQYSARLFYTPPNIAGGPMWLNGALAWKTANAQRILNDQWILALASTL